MSLIAKYDNEQFERELPSTGVYAATCVWIIDVGMQESTFKGVTKLKRKLKLFFELAGSKMEDGRPFLVSTQMTLTLFPKGNLKPFLEAWRGRSFTTEEMAGFDMKNILSKPCQINIIHNQAEDGNTYANIGSIMPLGNGMLPPVADTKPIFYSTEAHNEGMYQMIPEGIRNKINREPQNSFAPAAQPAQNSFAPAAQPAQNNYAAVKEGIAPAPGGQSVFEDDIPF